MSSNEYQNRLSNTGATASNLPTVVPYNHHSKAKRANQNSKLKTSLYHNVRIGNINVQTAKDEIKFAEYVTQVKELKHDICFFQETHKIGIGEIEFNNTSLKGWRIIYT